MREQLCPDCRHMSAFYRQRGAVCVGHQNADGMPHMTYFIKERGLSFVWNGIASVIDVSIGGYGEPVYHRIPVEPAAGRVELRAFYEICERWSIDHPLISERHLYLQVRDVVRSI